MDATGIKIGLNPLEKHHARIRGAAVSAAPLPVSSNPSGNPHPKNVPGIPDCSKGTG
jgi:hypothetical protein